jgi:hypothetical protein
VKRVLLNGLTLLSLLACLVVASFWIRSYAVQDELAFTGGRRMLIFSSCAGAFVVSHTEHAVHLRAGVFHGQVTDPAPVGGGYVPALLTFSYDDMGPTQFVTLPHWAVLVVAAALPVGRIRGRRRRPAFPVQPARADAAGG